MSEPARTPDGPPCPECGYHLRGLPPDGHCPECGAETFPTTSPSAGGKAGPSPSDSSRE